MFPGIISSSCATTSSIIVCRPVAAGGRCCCVAPWHGRAPRRRGGNRASQWAEMALACLGVCAGAVGAPLNPGYRAEQFDFYLSALNAQALIMQPKSNSEAVAAARAQGIRIIELSPMRDAEAGIFTLNGDELIGQEGASYAGVEDTALLLHTSGTTSRPKIVPLTHLNLCSSAENIAASLSLAEADRCMNVTCLPRSGRAGAWCVHLVLMALDSSSGWISFGRRGTRLCLRYTRIFFEELRITRRSSPLTTCASSGHRLQACLLV